MGYSEIKTQLSRIDKLTASEVMVLVFSLSELQDEKLDDSYMNRIKQIEQYWGNRYSFTDRSWHYYPSEISKGAYGLKKIPEHVRNTARDLYYAK